MAPKLVPLIDIDHHLQDDSPATHYVRTSLTQEDVVVFTDSKYRDTFKQTTTIMNVLERKWKPVVLHEEDHEHKSSIEEILNRITNSAPPPHLFYKQKYYASGSKIHKLYAHGQLEHALGMPSTIVH